MSRKSHLYVYRFRRWRIFLELDWQVQMSRYVGTSSNARRGDKSMRRQHLALQKKRFACIDPKWIRVSFTKRHIPVNTQGVNTQGSG
jgi:hypothetical protein